MTGILKKEITSDIVIKEFVTGLIDVGSSAGGGKQGSFSCTLTGYTPVSVLTYYLSNDSDGTGQNQVSPSALYLNWPTNNTINYRICNGRASSAKVHLHVMVLFYKEDWNGYWVN